MKRKDELYQKYRPSTFKAMIGQEAAIKSLQCKIDKDKVPHALLFSGPSGVGKTTAARIVAASVGSDKDDVREINAASSRGIDEIRNIEKAMKQYSLSGGTKTWIIDEAHKLTSDAMNAILKPLEEPPDDCYFILASSIPNKLLKTIISRCTEVKFKAFTPVEIRTLVTRIATKEGKEVSDDVLTKIVELAEGNGRKAIVLLEQTIDEEDEAEQLKLLMATESEEIGIQICRRLMDFKLPPKVKWAKLNPLLWKVDQYADAEEIRRSVLGYARKVMLGDTQMGGRAARCKLIITVFRDHFFDCGPAGLCDACYEVCNEK